MNLLFYQPTSHLSIYFISHILFHFPSYSIYVILPQHPHFSIHQYWSSQIELYKLQYLYQLPTTNLSNLNLISQKDFIQNKDLHNFISSSIDLIFYHFPNHLFPNKINLKKEWNHIFNLKKPIFTLVPIEIYKESMFEIYKKRLLQKKIQNKIFYHGIYFGEEERNIINFNDHPFYLKFKNLQNNKPSLLQIDHLHSIYEYFHQNLQNIITRDSNNEYIFINTMSPTEQNEIKYEDSYIETFLKKYHESLFQLFENNEIDKICYKKNTDWLYSSSSSTPELTQYPLIKTTYNQFILLSSFIVIFIILCLTLYFYCENKNYLFLMIVVTSWKLPLLLHKFKNDFFESLPHLFKLFSGKIIFEDDDIHELDKKNYCYYPINPTLYEYHSDCFPIQSSFPILNSIIQKSEQHINQDNIKYIIPIYTINPLNYNSHKELSFYLKNHQQTTTVIGKPILIDSNKNKNTNTNDLEIEIQRLVSKYNQTN